MIIKHRRGTTEEWQELDLHVIPEAGELVIEECSDGTSRCKIGTGTARFSKLPYIDDKLKTDLLLEIASTETAINNRINTVHTNFLAEIATIEEDIRAIVSKRSELVKDYTDKDNIIKSTFDKKLAETVELLTGELSQIREQSKDLSEGMHDEVDLLESKVYSLEQNFTDALAENTNILKTTRSELANDIKTGDANIKAIFTKNINDTAELLRAELSSLASNAGNASAELKADLVRVEAKLDTAKEALNTALTEAKDSFNTRCQELVDDFTARDASLGARLNQSLSEAVNLLQAEISTVDKFSTDVQVLLHNEIARLETALNTAEDRLNTTIRSVTENFNTKCIELSSDYISRDANLKTVLSKNISDATEHLDAKIIAISESLHTMYTDAKQDIARIDAKIESIESQFSKNLTDILNDFSAQYNEFTDDYITRDNLVKELLIKRLDDTKVLLMNEISSATKLSEDAQVKLQTEIDEAKAEIKTIEQDFDIALADKVKDFNARCDDLISDYTSRDANVRAVFDVNLTNAIASLQAEISAAASTAQSNLLTETSKIDAKIEDVKETSIVELTNSINSVKTNCYELTADYIARDASLKAVLDQNLADLDERLNSEIKSVTERIEELQINLQTEINSITSKIEMTESSLTKAINDAVGSFRVECTELTEDYITRDANLKAILENNLKTAIEQVENKLNLVDLAAKSANDANKQLSEDINQLKKDVTDTATALTSKIDQAKQEVTTDFDTKLASKSAVLRVAINELDKQINGQAESNPGSAPGQQAPAAGETKKSIVEQVTLLQDADQQILENVETLRSNTNLKFMEVQEDLTQLTLEVQGFDPKLSNKLTEVRAEIANNKAITSKAIADVSTQLAATSEQIQVNAANISENTRRINNIIAPTESELTRDEEVIDIRIGYNGVDHASAGDAVRAVGKDLENLKASLPSYIPANAVDGLEYIDNELYLVSKGVQVGNAVTITGGSGGGGSVSTVRVTNNLPSTSFTVSKGTQAWINFTYTSFENEVPTGDGVYSISINNSVIEVLSGNIQHGVPKLLNVIAYLKNGSNTIKVTCSDQYGSSRSLVYTISQVELRIESSFNSAQIFNDTITFRYKVFGQIDKTAYVLVDDNIISEKTLGASVSGNEITLLIPKQTHGCHRITAYVSADINGNTVPSETLEYEIICIEADTNAAILASTNKVTEVTQGDLVSIPFMVYDPDFISTTVKLTIYSKVAGELTKISETTRTVDRAAQFWNTRTYPTGNTVFEISYTYDDYGTQKTVTKAYEIKVTALEVDIAPEEDSIQLYLTAQGRSNNEQNPGVWTYTQAPDGDKTYDTVTTTFTDFNWKSNGWITDAEGDTCLRLNGDAKAVINFKPFAEDFKANGKTIEFEFVVHDVNDRDAIVIDCFDGDRGFRATPDTAFLKSSGTEVSCRYKDEERVRVAITVEHSDTTSRFVSIYLDGILSGVQRYADTDNFQQNNPVTIKLGSSLCGLDVYNIRIYNKALSTAAVLNNYIADQTVPATRLQLMTDNDILDENGKVSYDRVKALGQIPIITFTGPMPTYKGDKKKKTTRMKFEDPTHPEMNFDVLLDQIDVQGTSSQFYIRKNWKVKLPEARAHMPGAIPAKVYCIKVDYAEATGTHNTGVANYVETFYDREEVTLPPQKDDTRVRTTIQGFPIIIFEKETEDSEPVFSSKGNFNYDKDAENAFGFTEAYEDYGVECWEFCNNTSDPVNFAGEIATDWLEDFEPRYAPKSANFERIEELKEIEELAASGKGIMTEAQRNELATLMSNCIANFKEMHDWVLSTATYTLADGKKVAITPTDLAEPVTYGETTYTKDNEEYRLAKFKYEFRNYFNMHYSSMYYVFTFFALMTDQRAKNLFLTRWKEEDGVYRWYPYFYDNDTIFGINNEGALVFDYFHEDTDQLGSSNVFNGQNSVLWNNFRLCFPQEIQATYAKLRSDKKLTYNAIINQFVTEGSDKWSAAIYNADADYKYISMAREHVAHKDEDGNEVTGIDASNLYQVRGPGEHHLRYFIDNRINYCDSKWYAGNYPSDDIFLRIYTPKPADDATQEETDRINASLAVVPANPNITITPFSDMYAGVRYKSGTLQQQRLKAGESFTFRPLNEDETFGDTETAIYGAGEISSLGDLSGLYCGVINLSNATKLTELTVGNADPAYYNDNFREISVGSNRLLRSIDLRNCSGLGIAGENPQNTLELSGCSNIESIYTEGTNLASVSLPDSGYVKVLHLPASVNTIVIKNQHYLYPQSGVLGEANFVDGFSVAGYQNVRTLCIENCPNLNTNEILEQCCDENGKYTVERVRLTGIEWGTSETPLADANFIKSLFPCFDAEGNLIGGIRGIDEKNNPLEDAYLVGTCYIAELSGGEYAEIKGHYPNLDIKYGKMTSTITFKYTDEAGVEHTQTVPVYGENSSLGDASTFEPEVRPYWPLNDAFTYTFVGWSRRQQTSKGIEDTEEDYKDYLQADALTGIAGNRTLYPVFKAVRRSYMVTFVNPTAPEDTKILGSVEIPYGEPADYTKLNKPLPDKLDGASPELYELVGWYSQQGTTEKVIGEMTFEAQFAIKDQNRLPGGEDDEDTLPGYTIGWPDITGTDPETGAEARGYSLNDLTNMMSITKCYNKFNAAISIPSTMTYDSKTYSVRSLGGFSGHSQLELISIPNTVEELLGNAFADCTKLYEIKLPDYLRIINSQAFRSCSKLKKFTIPATVDTIGSGILYGCINIEHLTVVEGNNNFKITQNCLVDTRSKTLLQGLVSGIIPTDGSVTSLGSYCFAGMPITALQIPDGITSVPDNGFSHCEALSNVVLPSTITELGPTCFAWCYRLSNITLPERLTNILTYVFYKSALTNVDIPASVTKIASNAFGEIKSLATVTFKNTSTIPDVHHEAFSGSGTVDAPTVFNLPWTLEQHLEKFKGTYTDNETVKDKDIFFGATIGSTITFADAKVIIKRSEVENGSTVTEVS